MFFAYSAGTPPEAAARHRRHGLTAEAQGPTPCGRKARPTADHPNGLRPNSNALRAITIMHLNQELVQVPRLMNQ